ncbi:MAG: chemotaxis response regulator CheB [Halieaceae bacterium]|jgi:chemotaxis response regulator CheB
MDSDNSPVIGLATDIALANALEAHFLVAGFGARYISSKASENQLKRCGDVDIWIIDAQAEDLYHVLVPTGKYLLPAENPPPLTDVTKFSLWVDGIIRQVDTILAVDSRELVDIQSAKRWNQVEAVWLLAGSAGASSAIQSFLNAFRAVPPVAFIYAQHFDPDMQNQLEQLTLENRSFTLRLGTGMCQLAQGRVLMIPPRSKVTLNSAGELYSTRSAWEGDYTPDINEILVIMAAAELPARGVIFFSGMGNDGAKNLSVLEAVGARIWAQSPSSAICSAMPQAAIDTGLVTRSDDPAELARILEMIYTD